MFEPGSSRFSGPGLECMGHLGGSSVGLTSSSDLKTGFVKLDPNDIECGCPLAELLGFKRMGLPHTKYVR